MTVRTTLLSLFSFIAIPAVSFANGSVAYDEVRKLLPKEVRDHLEFAFEIEEVGEAIRLGKHFGDLGGGRMGPYYFSAKSKARGGSACTIGIITNSQIVDAKGKEVEDPSDAKDLLETFDFYEVRFGDGESEDEVTETPDRRMPGRDVDRTTRAPKLSAAEKEDVVAAVRAVYADVEKMELEFDGGQMKSDDEQSGDIIRGYARYGSIRKIEFNVATGDHGGFTVEIFTDRKNRPSFILWEEIYWSFDPKDSNKTIDTVVERRFYFSPQGQLAKALEKSYSGSGERDLEKKRDAAKNSDFNADPAGVQAFFKALTEVIECDDAKLKGLANDFWSAQNVMIGH